MKEIEQIIKNRKANYKALYGNVVQKGMSEEQFIAKAIEQYVIKARIEELQKAKGYWLHDCASWCDGRIEELKKG